MTDLAQRVDATWAPLDLEVAPPPRMKAFVPIWRRPWMALGAPTYGSSLLARLGVANVFDARGPYPEIELPEATLLDPDVVLAPSEPYPFTTRQLPELETVARVQFVDGKDLFWWGARTRGALDRFGELFSS
jgi:ABC-type Fe3+-hydroxamate transport system substrate-binding protein